MRGGRGNLHCDEHGNGVNGGEHVDDDGDLEADWIEARHGD
jgi:hypothetical protein